MQNIINTFGSTKLNSMMTVDTIMSNEEVVLRRHKPSSHLQQEDHEGLQQQRSRLPRGQSAYMALLSSLATDLDLMLNDLRSSPTSRYIQQQQPSPSTSGIRSTQSTTAPTNHQQKQQQQSVSTVALLSHRFNQNSDQQHQKIQPTKTNPFRQQQHQNLRSQPFEYQKQKFENSCSRSSSCEHTTFFGGSTSFCSSAANGRHEQNFLWSSETTTTTSATSSHHQQLKTRRLPFIGVDSIGAGCVSGGGGLSIRENTENHGLAGVKSSNILNAKGLTSGNVGIDSLDSFEADGDGCCPDGDGLIEDDLQALLPNCRQLSRDELSQSRASIVSSSDGGVMAEGETSSETPSEEGSTSPPCDLGLVERLLRTHPVWFLPGIQRAGAVHLLQGKEEGNFVVRGSSQANTMAVSVRLPPDTGPYIEHYLIQSNDGILSLESSRFKFDSIPALIAHYAQCCDELPVQLTLPRALREAKNRQQLSSLALLGQEFWRYPMANPKQPMIDEQQRIVDTKSPSSLTDTSGIGTTVFSSTNSQQQQTHHQPPNNQKVFSPTNPLVAGGIFSQAGTPSDTGSSLSSFATSTPGNNQQLMSPESIDSVVLTMSPVDNRMPASGIGTNATTNKLSTFKTQIPVRSNGHGNNEKVNNSELPARASRPTPPNTLNLAPLRTPPAPPVRWSKPLTPLSPAAPSELSPTANNFTVTTTVTFSVDNNKNQQPQQVLEVISPTQSVPGPINSNGLTTSFQTFAKRLSPEGECKTNADTLSSQGSSNRWHSQNSKDSNQSHKNILSPNSNDASNGARQRRIKARAKESKHYQESDILESPQVYCRSALGDKISDYEDLWTQQPDIPLGRGTQLSSFRPDGIQGKRPDLLPETPTVTSLSCNILSPANSISSSSIHSNAQPFRNDSATAGFVLLKPVDLVSPMDANKNFINHQPQPAAAPRNRLGLLLPLEANTPPDMSKSELETPTSQAVTASRSKQGSPFYAEPADALRAAQAATVAAANGIILRRSQRNILLPANHRHSEPPKSGGPTRVPVCPTLSPAEIEKIAGSLDELKKKQHKRLRGILDPWPLDSSWEFMSNNENDEYGDYDSEEQWNGNAPLQLKNNNNHLGTSHSNKNINNNNLLNSNSNIKGSKPLTVHQIIAKRMPDLNLPELVRSSTPQSMSEITPERTMGNGNNGGSRISSYDNVERNAGSFSYTTSFLNGLIDSAQSDDGTVFSEPWDSSQWDSFLPHDDTSDSIHLSKCRPAICNSEDDTIIEESTFKDNHGTLKANKNQQQSHQQKVATILRSRSCRDREILCHPRNKCQSGGPGDSVGAYTLQLAQDPSSTFARNIENFIACTKESREAAPQVVMRNMRQFMSGMKNYLVKHGEGDFQQEVQKARSRLKSDEFLNLDAILETVMHQLVVLPLREHLYGLFVDYYTRTGDIQLLVENVKYACSRSPADFGIRPSMPPPTSTALNRISTLLLKLQETELPLEKLDLFLCVVAAIFEATGCSRGQLGADDFLPILVYVVAKCGFVGAEIEAEFMWGLLQPPLLSGEAGYYLTALCSAVHVLKSFMASDNEGSSSLDWRSSSLPACSSVLRVIIPDEYNGSLQTRTLPVRPHTTTKEVCRIIAHKARITNPQDYGLFKLVDGEETILTEAECPQDARLAARGKHCMLAYKRIDAKIAWPTTATSASTSASSGGIFA